MSDNVSNYPRTQAVLDQAAATGNGDPFTQAAGLGMEQIMSQGLKLGGMIAGLLGGILGSCGGGCGGI